MHDGANVAGLVRGLAGSNPALPARFTRVGADMDHVTNTELAWAAGVYDGEGSASTYLPKQRKSRVRQMAVYQGGDSAPPPLLLRFRTAVGDVGLIHGPARGYLYQWHSRRHVVVDSVSELLWPWISEVKRDQLRAAAQQVGRAVPDCADACWSAVERGAWAAGFFDGEGTIGAYGDPRRPAPSMSIPQASAGAVPQTLLRFREIVGTGRIAGPRTGRSPWSKLPQYRWELTSFAEIERVVAMLAPYSDIVKREQMCLCLERVRDARERRRAV